MEEWCEAKLLHAHVALGGTRILAYWVKPFYAVTNKVGGKVEI